MRRLSPGASIAKFLLFSGLLAGWSHAQTIPSVLTQRNDPARDGVNASEAILTPANVNTTSFGKVFTLPVDGAMFAQPLYVPGLSIAGAAHNVVYAATMHDSVFAFDADGQSTTPLWSANLATRSCPAGFTCSSVPFRADYVTSSDTMPEIGIMSTPIIDSTTNTMYVVAKTQEVSSSVTNYVFRLHALDITTGAERVTPMAISGQVAGTGNPNSGGKVQFSPQYTLQRPGLTIANGAVIIAFGSAGDDADWHGWVFSYDKTSLSPIAVFSPTPNGSEGHGGIWMHGNGLVTDSAGNVYFSTGNGAFDGATNYGDAFLKLATPGLTVSDYFAPYNQQSLDNADLDVAAGGLMLLPDSAGTMAHPHIMIGCAKNGAIYVMDRDQMGNFQTGSNSQIIQSLLNVIGNVVVDPLGTKLVGVCFSSPAYWQGNMYIGGINDGVKTFTFSNGLLSTAAVATSPTTYQYPGSSPVISANGTTNGIVWAVENGGTLESGDFLGTIEILHAYDATNVAHELYNSSQVGSDSLGTPAKFVVPTVANGRVYVGTSNAVAAFGLLGGGLPQAAAPTFSVAGGAYSAPVSVTITETTSGTTVYYTLDGTQPSASSNKYTGAITISTLTTLNAVAIGTGLRNSPITTATYVIGSTGSGFAYVQGNYVTPQSTQTSVTIPFTQAQHAGDLNIVIAAWNDAVTTIPSGGITDTGHNVYTLAAGPTAVAGVGTEAIYYAKDIAAAAAGANTVTVHFSAGAPFPDVRVLEYQGADPNNPFDIGAVASGSGTSSSVPISTSTTNELIVAGNYVLSYTTNAGTGFTQRILTSPDGDIAEDAIVPTAGAYSANAPLKPTGGWVMNAAAFKAPTSVAGLTVSSVAPNTGSTAGGTAVTINGSGFVSGATVTFAGNAATNVVVVSGTQITATTPAHATGAVAVAVSNPGGQNFTLSNAYTYIVLPPPVVTTISPTSGTTLGGTAVTIGGSSFVAGATVTFGAAAATNVTVTATSITATTPANSAGATNVIVTNPDAQSSTLANGFTYISSTAPTISGVTPTAGALAGGTNIAIAGTNFVAAATVLVGGNAATNVVVVGPTSITATTPSHVAGAVPVLVTNPNQEMATLANGFTYNPAPTVSTVNPQNGTIAGGTAVTITGTGFLTGATVTIGGTAATNVVVTATQITATTSAGSAGAASVVVTNPDTQTATVPTGYTYLILPTITGVVASQGPAAGGTNVTISGTNFATGATVSFGGTGATNVVVVGPTQITATTPLHAAGAVTVNVTNPDTQNFNLANGFTFVAAPVVNTINPSSGTTAGGTAVTIAGTGFVSGATVTFDGTPATGVTVTPTQITATTPSHAAGAVTVVVTNPDTQFATVSSGFTYFVVPTITGVLPTQGTTLGGTNVTISGTNFAAGATVSFGGTAATNVVVVGPTQITATTPAHAAGAVTVNVTNPDTQTSNLASGFIFVAPPVVNTVTPSSGTTAGGTAVTIAGTGFVSGATVTFDGIPATGVTITPTQIAATTPTHAAGAVTVVVTNPDTQFATVSSGFTYFVVPTITGVLPTQGTTLGGTNVTISGTNFAAGATVSFGGTAATNVVVVGPTQITATTPAHAAGAVTVNVTNPDTQNVNLASGFTFVAPPVISTINPGSGTTAGGTIVTIAGTGFVGGTSVTFDGTPATGVTVTPTQITATTPAHATGAVTVAVTNPDTQTSTVPNGFTYFLVPSISNVAPAQGTTLGGTNVTINGANFATGATVAFGGVAATNVVVVGPTQVTATTPAHAAGAVTINVTNPDTQTFNLTNGFTFVAPPAVSSLNPASGTTVGGTVVTIAGSGFVSGSVVTFDGIPATNVTVNGAAQITATTPAHAAGAVTVVVTNPDTQFASVANGFNYLMVPAVTGVLPNQGPTAGGTNVTISGNNFVSGATVTFGGVSAGNVVVTGLNQITATAPAHVAGAVAVAVTNPDAQNSTLANAFTYIPPPAVSGVSPNSGTSAGGSVVLISGSGFLSGASVTFDGIPATSVSVTGTTQIMATTPVHAAGAVTVAVTNPDGQSGNLINAFTYVLIPTLTGVSPISGRATGATPVTLSGMNFGTGATVTFGGTAATSVVVVSPNQITAMTPAHAAGAVTVTVTNPGNQSSSLVNAFTYVAAPTLTSVTPNSGVIGGGTSVTLAGTNFLSGATVTFGGTAATNVVVSSATKITATTPAHAAGAAAVVVTNPDGQSVTLANGFTFNTTVVAVAFGQVASTTPQTATQTIPLAYPSAQTAGDLNVVVVGWDDTVSTVKSVTDSAGNVYSLAIGPTANGTLRQSIYFAPNIKAGSNTVTVTFSQAATYPDIRILEYRGVSAVDVAVGATGSGTTASSGSATTTVANELIFGAAEVMTGVKAAGTGFTSRVITHQDADNAEDRVVTATGSYSATATISPTGAWIMQMVAFK